MKDQKEKKQKDQGITFAVSNAVFNQDQLSMQMPMFERDDWCQHVDAIRRDHYLRSRLHQMGHEV